MWEEKTKAEVARATLGDKDAVEKIIRDTTAQIARVKDQIKRIDDSVKGLTELNDRFQAFVDQFIKLDDKGSNALALFAGV